MRTFLLYKNERGKGFVPSHVYRWSKDLGIYAPDATFAAAIHMPPQAVLPRERLFTNPAHPLSWLTLTTVDFHVACKITTAFEHPRARFAHESMGGSIAPVRVQLPATTRRRDLLPGCGRGTVILIGAGGTSVIVGKSGGGCLGDGVATECFVASGLAREVNSR